MIFLRLLFVVFLLLCASSCAITNAHYNPHAAHHTRFGFRNPHIPEEFNKRKIFHWTASINSMKSAYQSHAGAGFVTPDLQKIDNPTPHKTQVTWIGHSSFLIQYNGINILTDPVFSDRTSPVSFVGPTRLSPLGLTFEQLPKIDYVLISHNHYDHLDTRSLIQLGDHPKYFVPLGIKQWFKNTKLNYTVNELDWWDTLKEPELKITSVPAQHFSSRTLLDFNETLWCGWVIDFGQDRKIYFAGDTGFSKHFKEIGSRIGPMELSLIPIGAYEPRHILKHIHVNPEEAVKIHKDVKSKNSLGMHWGTFRLTGEPSLEPPRELRSILNKYGVSTRSFRTIDIGQTVVY